MEWHPGCEQPYVVMPGVQNIKTLLRTQDCFSSGCFPFCSSVSTVWTTNTKKDICPASAYLPLFWPCICLLNFTSKHNMSDNERVLQYLMLHYLLEALPEKGTVFTANIAHKQSKWQLLSWRPCNTVRQKQRGNMIFC